MLSNILNQKAKVYKTKTNYRGETEKIEDSLVNIKCRLTNSNKRIRTQENKEEITVSAEIITEYKDLQRGDTVEYNGIDYTVERIDPAIDLNGDVLFLKGWLI